ncbi:UvrD-helicase domain-containing protein [Jatrophihabitans telluris]|uniref:DNA 3'-5' helicase n=1 Tax=Jatrophihabitans telluris TaxID=2038343 RepID=A0ABY4R317_9ACTN|nr:ATP-dependent helicase [Jatrophihabitans telluris]UQX89727.1 UvrD-helicase domain-containing protein [Jatrophihabitans telluris]
MTSAPTNPPADAGTSAAAMLSGLDPEQRTAAQAVRGPVCILAGAGTGKTRAITHRIAYAVRSGVVPADAVLAVTFTARAAGELRTRLRALGVGGVQARTFHAAALRQLNYFAPKILGGPMPQVADSQIRWIIQAANRMKLRTDRAELRDLASEIDWAKSSLVSPQDYVAAAARANRGISLTPAKVADVYAGYEEAKQRNNEIDFADLLLIMSGALESDERIAAQVRGQYRYFVIDEYQDVSPLQQRLLTGWLGDRDDICVVGDANQTIYSFAGARPSYLLDFGERYPQATVVRLERDYRSTPQIVELANGLISAAGGERGAPRLRLVGQRPPGPKPTFAEHDDEVAEATSVASSIKKLLAAGTPAAEIAVLFRINAQSEVYEQALSELGIPYILRGGEKFFERAEIRQAVVLLRGAARADDGTVPLPELVVEVLSSVGWNPEHPPPGGAARERWESLAALRDLADQFVAEEPEARLDTFNADLEQRAASQHAPTVQGITLASLHSAKGLEWDAVFLVGLVDGTIPIQHATTPEQQAEERRLLYVGVTRARQRLALSWALARNPGQARRRRPSRLLDGLRPGATPRQSGPAKKAKVVPQSDDAATFGRLRAWRKKQAESQGVPAYVVFSDATLVAIADGDPQDEAALAHIPGVGPTKLARYAVPVLAVLAGADPEPVDVD